ncbi:winged helix-turn-helix domain-containing protein [Thalassotalea psychrophila]|uniref:Winged helix-turn-helix domain-containing protein n=1 Tax=Thalassotalea psychrophila TaxID=3065647 RepID=A0ABY9TQL5_9GAMM|nr:winged helix-turn-helix domain-containing protein [Colwelliaceae bacterium SQ149]
MSDKPIKNKTTESTVIKHTVDGFSVPKELHNGFSLGDVVVEPDLGLIIRNSERHHVAPKAMEILLFLAANNCEIVSREQILSFGWGDTKASKTNITHIISEIRHALDDHKECPTYIQTIPRKGYRMMQPTLAKPSSGLFGFTDDYENQPPANTRWRLTLSIFKSSRLFKASAAYVLISWVLLQVFSIVLPVFNAPSWGVKFATLILIVGFPLVISYQWLKELKFKRQHLISKANKAKFFYQQLFVDSFFVCIVLSVIYYLSTHLITFIEVEAEQQTSIESSILTVEVVDNAVAVLSFNIQNSSTNGEQLPEYVVSGLQEELINYLAQKPSFKVASMRATNALETDANIDVIKGRLGVRYILEGKAKYEQNKIIVNTSLIDSVSGFQVWGVETKGELTKILSLYAELSRKVVSALHLLVPDNNDQLSNNQNSMPTTNFEAYDAYLQGKNEYRKTKSINSLMTAESLFNIALKLDPEFIKASAALCLTYLDLYLLGKDPQHYAKGVEVCDLTASYKSESVDSYLSLGKLNMIRGKQQDAIKYLEQALAINNQATDVIATLAEVYFNLEDKDKAEELYLRAIELEPAYWRNHYQFGIFLHYTGQYERAVSQFNKVNLLNDNVANSYNALGGAYFLMMDWENASVAWSKALAIEPSALTYSNLATSLFFLKQFDNAAEIYLQGSKLTPNDNTIWANLGEAYKYSATQNNKAFGAFNKALELALQKEIINPKNESIQSQIARYYSELDQCSVADSYAQTVLNKLPTDPYIFYSLSLMYLNCDRIIDAEYMIENTIKLGYPKELLLADPQFLVYKEQLSKLFNN